MQLMREPCLTSLWDITTPDGADRRFRDEIYDGLPHRFKNHISVSYRAAYKKGGIAKANGLLLDVSEIIGNAVSRFIGNDSEVCEWARDKAQECQLIEETFADQSRALFIQYLHMCELAMSCGVLPPDMSRGMSMFGAVKRMCANKWWRSQARKYHGRSLESVAVKLNMVNRKKNLFVSDESVERRAGQKRRNRDILESRVAVNEHGDSYTLAALSDLGVSNPTIRRGELMVRMSGFEKMANAAGHVGEFYTLTCPSRMHSSHYETGVKNRKYDGTTPRRAQKFLCGQWAKARAELARLGIEVYGFRVCEPHHDGTPHWHMLFFMREEDSDAVRKVLLHYALGDSDEDRNEDGAAEHRFKAKRIDPKIGTATGYLAKYICKNIDGHGLKAGDEALFDRTPATFAARVDAWAATWGIRQFQQIGGASVEVYRELRRLPKGVSVNDPIIEAARFPVDQKKPDWCGYLKAQSVGRVSLYKVWSDEPGAYGDPLGWKVVGVESLNGCLESRRYQWTVTFEKKSIKSLSSSRLLPDVSACFSSFILPFGAAEGPWSPVNNCTEPKVDHDKKSDREEGLPDHFDQKKYKKQYEGGRIEVHRPNTSTEKIH